MRKPRPASWSRINARRCGLVFAAAIFIFLIFAPAPNAACAASQVWPTGFWGPILSCTGNYNQVAPESGPLKGKTCDSFCDLLRTAQNATDFGITLVIFVGAPAMIAFGGVMLLVAGSSPSGELRNKAKDVIVSALIGVGITLGAYIMISTFLWLFGNDSTRAIKVSWPNIECKVPEVGPG